VSNSTSTCFTLLRVPAKPLVDIPVFADDSYALASQCDDRHLLGHIFDLCYALHVHPPLLVAVVQIVSLQTSTVSPISSDTP